MRKLIDYRRFAIYFRLPLLILSLYILKHLLLTLSLYNNTFTLMYFILWFLTLLTLQINEQIDFVIAFFFFILTIYSRASSLKYLSEAENYAGWMFFFLTTGVIHLFLIEKIGLKAYPFKKIFSFFEKDTRPFIFFYEKIWRSMRNSNNNFVIFVEGVVVFVTTVVGSYLLNIKSAVKSTNYFLLFKYLMVTISVLLILQVLNYQINRFFIWSSIQPRIVKIEPKIVYRSSKIILWGKSFGADPNGSLVRVMTADGQIHKDFWTESKIYFTAPLNWKDGTIKIWIEKPVHWDGKIYQRKSNVVAITLLPTDDIFSQDDEEYFKQLKYLDKETLQLNGYK